MKSAIVALSATQALAGGTLSLDWKDCGDSSYHAKVTSVKPDTLVLGQKTKITGSGTVDEQVTGGSFAISAKFGIISEHYNGDVCSPKTFNLPLGVGSITWDSVKCPQAAGTVDVGVDVSLSGAIPASVAKGTIEIKATGAKKENLICLDINVQKQGELTGQNEVGDYEQKWFDFKKEFGKVYDTEVEEQQRFGIFKINVDYITAMNSNPQNSFTLGVTKFADLTADEFAASHSGISKPDSMWGSLPNLGTHKYHDEELADSIDWNAKGAVTGVKNQGQCGSCWSFSTTGSLEGAWEIATGKLVSLSEQQFVDCDKVDSGCSGGLMDHAFAFAEKNAICTEQSYPYHAARGTCEASSCTVGLPQGSVTGFKDVPPNSEQDLMSALNQQPVSIAIEADKSAFQLYKTGVLTGLCGATMDHGVLAVGYGTTEDGQKYWLVKNSWGSTWGDNGYVKLLRGKGGEGECGLLQKASYPVVEKTNNNVVV